jgi:hypothetical protein
MVIFLIGVRIFLGRRTLGCTLGRRSRMYWKKEHGIVVRSLFCSTKPNGKMSLSSSLFQDTQVNPRFLDRLDAGADLASAVVFGLAGALAL